MPRLPFGEGRISGAISIFLASLSFLAVFCFMFPELLTSPEFRAIYTGETMKILLVSISIASCFFSVLSFILSRQKHMAVIGMLICAATVFLGGFKVKGRVLLKKQTGI